MSDFTAITVGSEVDGRNNAGGGLPTAEMAERLGVVRHVTETYSVGEFRYTTLTDAIAQARRMTKLEQELLS